MARVQIQDFLFDEVNEDKMAEHGITARRALQVLDRPFSVAKNRHDRAATYMLYGIDDQGQCLALPILETYEEGLWRPVTAWFCKAGEWAKLPK